MDGLLETGHRIELGGSDRIKLQSEYTDYVCAQCGRRWQRYVHRLIP